MMRSEPNNKTPSSRLDAATNLKMAIVFLLFSAYVCVLYWREVGDTTPKHPTVLFSIGNGYAGLILAWLIRDFRGVRTRLVALVGICNFFYQLLIGCAPMFVSPFVPMLQIVFLSVWFIASLLSLSLVNSALTSGGLPPNTPRGDSSVRT